MSEKGQSVPSLFNSIIGSSDQTRNNCSDRSEKPTTMKRRVRFDVPSQNDKRTDNTQMMHTLSVPVRVSSVRQRKRDQPWNHPNVVDPMKPAVSTTRQEHVQRKSNHPSSTKTQTKVSKTLHHVRDHDTSLDPFEPFLEADIPWWTHNRRSMLKQESDDSLSPTSVLSLDSETSSSIVWAESSSSSYSSTPPFANRTASHRFKTLSDSTTLDVPFDEQSHSIISHSCIANVSSHHSSANKATETYSLLKDIQWSETSINANTTTTTTNTTDSQHPPLSHITERINTIISQASKEQTPRLNHTLVDIQQKSRQEYPNSLHPHTKSSSEHKHPETTFEQVVMSTLKDLNIVSKSNTDHAPPTPVSSSVSSSSIYTSISSNMSRKNPLDQELLSKLHIPKSILSTSTSKAARRRPRCHVRFNDKVQFCSILSMDQEQVDKEMNSRYLTTTSNKSYPWMEENTDIQPFIRYPSLNADEDFFRAVAAIVIQAFVRRYAAYKLTRKRFKAIYIIQSFYRTHVQTPFIVKQKKTSSWPYDHQHDSHITIAAIRIQAVVRSWIARKCLLICGYCASVIQKAFRHYKRRCAFKRAMVCTVTTFIGV